MISNKTHLLLVLFITFSSNISFAQKAKNVNYDEIRDKIIVNSFEGSQKNNQEIDSWYFEFSCKDSLLLYHLINGNTSLAIKSIEMYTEEISHLKGMYIADCIDLSGVEYNSELALRKKVSELVKSYRKTPIELIGIGYRTNETTITKSPIRNIKIGKKILNKLEGRIINSKGEGIPFVTIGIENSEYGTVSSVEGNFKMDLPTNQNNLEITVRHISYKEQKLPLKDLKQNKIIQLKSKETILEEVTIKEKGLNLKTKIVGDKGKTNTSGFVVGGKEGTEIAQEFINTRKVWIKEVGVYVNNRERKQFTLLANIYEKDEKLNLPGNSILKEQIIINSDLEKGWLKVDLKNQYIITEKSFYVAFQWVDANLEVPYIGMTGKKKGLTKRSILGEWKDSKRFKWMINSTLTYIESEL